MTPRRISETDTKAQEEILALLHDAFAYMDGRIDPPSSLGQLTLARVARHAADHEIWALGDPIKACLFLTLKDDVLYLGKLAVAKRNRGQGLARELVAFAEQRGKALFYDTLELQSRIELTGNHRAFAAMGFVKTAEGSHPGYERVTEITMQKGI